MEERLQRYLHDHIPLTAAMGIEVRAATADRILLAAPLGPNVNHRATAFGGSIATLGIVAGWSWLWIELGARRPVPELVIARAECDYVRPLTGEIVAELRRPTEESVRKLISGLERRGRGRIDLAAELLDAGEVAAQFCGTYVAIARDL